MNDTNKEIIKKLERRMMRKTLVRVSWGLLLAAVILTVIYVGAGYYFGLTPWQGTETLYPLLHFLQDYGMVLGLLTLAVGGVAALLLAWKKTFDYLYEVIEAVRKVYDGSADAISLSDGLQEVENQLNYVKLSVQKSENAAREAEQRKNDLVVYLAHDLKTPLTSVIGYLTLLTEEREISEELQKKYLGISLNKAERLEDLINEFFEIARFNLTALTLEKSSINLTRMLEQIVFEFQPMLQEKNLTCTIVSPRDLILTLDADKMQRVFDNMLRNAVNYSFPDSEIVITAELQEEKIKITFFNHGNTIPEEKLRRIFEQFFRLDSSRGSRSGGAGLGLAIAKEIVELHGGTISADSREEQITFEIVLPQSQN